MFTPISSQVCQVDEYRQNIERASTFIITPAGEKMNEQIDDQKSHQYITHSWSVRMPILNRVLQHQNLFNIIYSLEKQFQNLLMNLSEQKHEKILNRIFHNPGSKVDFAKSQRILEKSRMDKAYNNEMLSIVGQHKIVGETTERLMNQQLNNIMTQLHDIDSISKFHDDHFKLNNKILFSPFVTPPATDTLKNQMSFQIQSPIPVKLDTQSSQRRDSIILEQEIVLPIQTQIRVNKASVQPLISQTNISHLSKRRISTIQIPAKSRSLLCLEPLEQVEFPDLSSQINVTKQKKTLKQLEKDDKVKKNRVLSREALFKILKAHQDKSSAEPFTFKRFQKQFQQFWDIRVRTMTKQDQLILSKLQNEEVYEYVKPLVQTSNQTKQMDQIQVLLKQEFDEMFAQNDKNQVEKIQLKNWIQQNKKKGDLKPSFGFRCQKFIDQIDEHVQKEKQEEKKPPENKDKLKTIQLRTIQRSSSSASQPNRLHQYPSAIVEDSLIMDQDAFLTRVTSRQGSPKVSAFNSQIIQDSCPVVKQKSRVYKSQVDPLPQKESYFNMKLQKILSKTNSMEVQAKDTVIDEKLNSKIENLFKISLVELIDDLTAPNDVAIPQVINSHKQTKSMSDYQKSMKKCDEILDRWNSCEIEMPIKAYEGIKVHLKQFRRANRRIQLYTK